MGVVAGLIGWAGRIDRCFLDDRHIIDGSVDRIALKDEATMGDAGFTESVKARTPPPRVGSVGNGVVRFSQFKDLDSESQSISIKSFPLTKRGYQRTQRRCASFGVTPITTSSGNDGGGNGVARTKSVYARTKKAVKKLIGRR